MSKYAFCGTLAGCLLLSMSCFAEIQYEDPSTNPSASALNQLSSQAYETVANCTVYASMVGPNTCDYTCSFYGGNTYKFRANIGLKGAFAWYVVSGNEPACFRSNSNNLNEARIKLYQAALRAGYRPVFAG